MSQFARHAVPATEIDLAEIMATSALADALAGWNASSEGAYLSVGDDLKAIYGMLKAVEEAMAHTIQIMTCRDITAIGGRLGEAAQLADMLKGNSLAIGERLDEVLKGHEDAADGNHQVDRTFVLLDYISLIARTHTGTMLNGADGLSAFFSEVKGFVGTGRALAARLTDRIGDLHCALSEANQQLQSRQAEEAQGVPLVALIASLNENLTVRSLLAEGSRNDARLAFDGAAQSVAEIVGVLQFHDIARQRLEHVIDHLLMLIRLANDGPLQEGSARLDPEVRMAFIAHIAKLERAQLLDLAQMYEARMAVINSSLDSVIHQSRMGADLIDLMLQVDRSSPNAGQQLGIAQQAQDLDNLFSKQEHRRKTLVTAVGDCIQATEQFAAMTDELDDIEFGLRLAGFNAAIHAAAERNGNNSIGYIAKEIRDNAATAKKGADLIRQGVLVTTHAANDLQSDILPTEIDAANTIRSILGSVLKTVDTAEGRCLAQLAGADVAAAAIPQRVAQAKSLMAEQTHGLSILYATVDALDIILAGIALDDADADLAELNAILSWAYTMKEERMVFDTLVKHPDQSENPSGTIVAFPSATPHIDDLSDVFF